MDYACEKQSERVEKSSADVIVFSALKSERLATQRLVKYAGERQSERVLKCSSDVNGILIFTRSLHRGRRE